MNFPSTLRHFRATLRSIPFIAFILLFVGSPTLQGAGIISDFESASQLSAWTFSNGPEFPGARGELVAANFSNSNCAELRYDFTVLPGATGAFAPRYVSAFTLVSAAQATGATKLRLKLALSNSYIKARIRIVDSGGQTLQYEVLGKPLLSSQTLDTWSVATIDLTKPSGQWGGANDGVLHAPMVRINMVLDASGQRDTGWLRFDEIEVLGPSSTSTLRLTNTTLSPAGANLGALADRVGVNIHFTKDDLALDLIKAAGFRWIRMDANWASVERSVGTYNFTDFDALVAAAETRNLHVLAILNYGHPVHTLGKMAPPRTPNAIKAFGAFCQSAAQHYSTRDVVFEIWNEPDIKQFWGGTPNVAEYAAVLREGIDSVKRGAPTARALTGGLSSPDNGAYKFWSELENRGAMSGAGGWSTHLYTSEDPETRWIDILQLKDRVNRVMPGQALWCTEWGYSSTKLSTSSDGHSGTARAAQARNVVRELLLGWWANLPLVVLYDIRDDGDDPVNPEFNFGLLARDYSDKPAMIAVRTLLTMANGRRAAGLMLSVDTPNDVHILRLDGSADKIYVIWAEQTASPLTMIIPSLNAQVWDMYGQRISTTISSTEQSFPVTTGNGPVYVQILN